jgi:hypothetical protein
VIGYFIGRHITVTTVLLDLVGQKPWSPALHEDGGLTHCALAMGQAPTALLIQTPPPSRVETGSSPRQSEASWRECPGDLADHVASVPLPLHGASAQDALEQLQETGGHEALSNGAVPALRTNLPSPVLSSVLHTNMEQRSAPEDHDVTAGSQPSLQAAGDKAAANPPPPPSSRHTSWGTVANCVLSSVKNQNCCTYG